jgi:hypothetical protein
MHMTRNPCPSITRSLRARDLSGAHTAVTGDHLHALVGLNPRRPIDVLRPIRLIGGSLIDGVPHRLTPSARFEH